MHEKGMSSKPARHHSYNGSYGINHNLNESDVVVHPTDPTSASTRNSVRKKIPKSLFKSKSSGQFTGQIIRRNPNPSQTEEDVGHSGSFPCSAGDSYLINSNPGGTEPQIHNDKTSTGNEALMRKESVNNDRVEVLDLELPMSITLSLEQQNNRCNAQALNALDHAERQSLKHLSASAPAIRTDLGGTDKGDYFMAPSSSKSRQKKFHRHFKVVPQEEKVLDYYSCALVGDILLQGFLYISENYFAFYSNVFGYISKLLIPVTKVVKITKEKTAKIFPNAVGIQTENERHVFASLISRDTTYKLMVKVWMHSKNQTSSDILIIPEDPDKEFDDISGDVVTTADESTGESGSGNDSASCSPSPGISLLYQSNKLSTSSSTARNENVIVRSIVPFSTAQIDAKQISSNGIVSSPVYLRPGHRKGIPTAVIMASEQVSNVQTKATLAHQQQQQATTTDDKLLIVKSGRKYSSLLIAATLLLVILFITAALLLMRISNLQQRLAERPATGPGGSSEQFYKDLISWQNRLHSNSAEEINQFLDTNLQQIIKVRESLEALSTLFMTSGHDSRIMEHSHTHLGNTEG